MAQSGTQGHTLETHSDARYNNFISIMMNVRESQNSLSSLKASLYPLVILSHQCYPSCLLLWTGVVTWQQLRCYHCKKVSLASLG